MATTETELHEIAQTFINAGTQEEMNVAALAHLSTRMLEQFGNRNNQCMRRFVELQTDCIEAYMHAHEMDHDAVSQILDRMRRAAEVMAYLETVPD